MELFTCGLAQNGFKTPSSLMEGLEAFMQQDNPQANGFLTQSAEGALMFGQLTWAGKMSCVAVVKHLMENKDILLWE